MAEKSSALMEETTTIRLETSLDHCIVMRFVQRTKSNMNASSIKVKRRFLPFLPGCTSDLWWPRARGRSTLANEGTMPSRPGSPGAETRDLTNGTYTFPASASFALGRLLAGLVRGVRALRTDSRTSPAALPPSDAGCRRLARLRHRPTRHARYPFPTRASRAPSIRRSLVLLRTNPLSETWLNRPHGLRAAPFEKTDAAQDVPGGNP